MRCKRCSQLEGRPFKRSHLVALRTTKISAMNPPSVARHGKLPPRRHEELPPPRIAEERVNEAGTNHGKLVVD